MYQSLCQGFISEQDGEVTFTPIEIPPAALQVMGRDGAVDVNLDLDEAGLDGKVR